MKCSVVITTYNRAKLLDRCLWSVLTNSNRQPDEIIIADDGGSDETPDVVKKYADAYRDTQISFLFINKPNRVWTNPAIARNRALRLTNPAHEVIIFSEPEMLWMSDTLSHLMGFFENPPESIPPDVRFPSTYPRIVIPKHFYLTASYIGYCLNENPTADERWRNPNGVFGHQDTDRRWPEHNTRLAAVLRDDVFAIHGWDESFVGWGYDDTDVMARLHIAGANHVALYEPVVHMKHADPPAGSGTAESNHAILQNHIDTGTYKVNTEDWGLETGIAYGNSISVETWKQIQAAELDSWTSKAWPSLDGKIYRERSYLKQAFADLGLETLPLKPEDVILDVGCGPYSILELFGRTSGLVLVGLDPLNDGYETIRPTFLHESDVRYIKGRGEKLPYGDGEVTLCSSINGIDHFQNPKSTLAEMYRVLKPGGWIALHYCINNASLGHPHPAHRIDLDIPTMIGWAEALGLATVSARQVYYGWRHQLAAALVFTKHEGLAR